VERETALRRALTVSVVSVVWSGAVGSVAVFSALGSGSLSTLGFGVDAVVDAAASGALIWRFAVERRQPSQAERVEKTAEAVVGLALVALSVYLAVASVRSLIEARAPVATRLALAVLVASLVLLPPIALFKHRVAGQLGSGALRADSVLTGVAAVLAAISLLGLGAASGWGWWWADAVAALAVTAVILREGAKSVAMSRAHRGQDPQQAL
jgi:divalent metal cation (Fe/Co/Zn/Cd) transporter